MLTFSAADPNQTPATDLVAAMVAEMVALYNLGPGTPLGTPLHAQEMAPPSGRFLIGWKDGEAVAGGGVRRLDAAVCEIKRMYVAPAHRSQGVAAALLAALEEAGRQLGYSVVRLDTGPSQAGARRLYERSGYRPIENYNGNPHAAFWGEKDLS